MGGFGTNSVSFAEIYDSNPGFDDSWRPQISNIASPLNLGERLAITGSGFRGVSGASGGHTQDSSTDHPLVQLRNVESGQTIFLLSTNWSATSFTSLPLWNFPPGYALATLLANGIPSASRIVNINVASPLPITWFKIQKLPNGYIQVSFTNSVGALFGVLATTNLPLPLNNWISLGSMTELQPGNFQFNDPQAVSLNQRYYHIQSP